MSFRTLAWAPAALAALLLVIDLLVGGAGLVHAEVEVAKVLWLAGAASAALAFEPGDYLRRGWMLIAVAAGFFLMRDALGVSALVIAGNVAQVWGVFVLTRVWSAAGLDDAVRGQRRALFGVAVLAALALTGPSIAHDLGAIGRGNYEGVAHLASDLGDAAGFVLLAALVRTALALRGGLVFWAWSLLAAGQLAWVLFDGARTLADVLGAGAWSPAVECLRILGAGYYCVAGVTQRRVVRHSMA